MLVKPINENHSIKEAVITLFLSTSIVKPQRFESLIANELKSEFQKFENVNQVQFRIQGNDGGTMENSGPEIFENMGFRFQKFEEGKIVRALQGINESLRSFISYHNLDYSRWNMFYEEFKKYMNVIHVFHPNLFISAISLHYIDEFIWESKDPIVNSEIFNSQSSILPKDFFVTQLKNFQFVTVQKEDFNHFDRLEIRVDEGPKPHIVISHNVAFELSEPNELGSLFVGDDFENKMKKAHSVNKKVLKNILNSNTCELINLV